MSAKNTNRSTGLCSGLLVTLAATAIAGCGGGGGAGTPTPAPTPTSAAPSIITQPAAATVADGASAQFSITAAGDAPLAYQWRRNGVDLADGAGITGATTATVNLTAPYPYNASQITVRVTNAAGNVVSGNALLTVTPVAPTIATQPANISGTVEAPAILSATISGGTPPVTYQWTRDGKVIAGATSASYTIASLDFRDNAAAFVLDITNPAGTFSTQAAMLSVLPKLTSFNFTVDTTDDLVDVDISDGKCLTVANNCSLRAAVMQADTTQDEDVANINVPAGIYKLTLEPGAKRSGSNGNLNLSMPAIGFGDIYITGAGAARTIIDGDQRDNVLEIGSRRPVFLNGLTLRNGRTVSGKTGGIISNAGNLKISDCVIENGRAVTFGGGIYSSGGVSLRRSTIRSNSAAQGGGLYVTDFTSNLVYYDTISGNQAIDGGGIYNAAIMYLVNSTISTNTADTNGGGIFAAAGSLDYPVETSIYSTSIIGNDADHDGDELFGGTGGGVFNATGSSFIVVNSLLARNTLRATLLYNDCSGNLEPYSFNLLGEASGCKFTGNSQAWGLISIDKVDPALKDNGGPTFTHAISDGPGSAREFAVPFCIDADAIVLTTDQRGAPRGTTCDIGAYQFGAVIP